MDEFQVPKCKNCGQEIYYIIEDVAGVRYTWEPNDDWSRYELVDTEHYGKTVYRCGECGAELDEEALKFFKKRCPVKYEA